MRPMRIMQNNVTCRQIAQKNSWGKFGHQDREIWCRQNLGQILKFHGKIWCNFVVPPPPPKYGPYAHCGLDKGVAYTGGGGGLKTHFGKVEIKMGPHTGVLLFMNKRNNHKHD